ncbi:cytochrome b561 and DOMON domain-containing protein At5g47530-like [Impatiens glandulifera]|uniref:cytochrome b561 and DOMON domain-containing protein At5g47530-like n=1 Tax=Impatiens glandulifera TaxID=253017 RepID=UPI001FB0EFCD|nr:cytochrome b561 and DOMON domain-containing protein At5g47530-like [Impatiens glandulifera]
MIGAQSLVAYQDSTGNVQAYTSPINSYNTHLGKADLSFNVPSLSAELRSSRNEMIIYATIELPTDETTFNHVWQEGPVINGNSMAMHSTSGENMMSTAIVDFSSDYNVTSNTSPSPPLAEKSKELPENDNNGGPATNGKQTCPPYTFSSNKIYRSCSSLSVLNSFLHWNYNKPNNTVDIAYRHADVTSSQWVSWALNLQNSGMIGAQCLVAYINSNNGSVHVYTSSITDYNTDMSQGALTFNVSNISGEFLEGDQMIIIYATLVLPAGKTTFNQVWQDGPVSGNNLGQHSTTGSNMKSFGTVDFSTEAVSTGGEGSSGRTDKYIHGIINGLSWGVMIPLGAMIARYLKVFKSAVPVWFYIHIICQTLAYIGGVVGLVTGLNLDGKQGNDFHKTIGVTLVVLGTLQVFALLLRPNKDHKYRFYWNLYHWGCGYATIILSIINIFYGIELLNPGKAWKLAYMGILILFGIMAMFLEVYTWIMVLAERKKGGRSSPKYTFAGIGNGEMSIGGYGSSSRSHLDHL